MRTLWIEPLSNMTRLERFTESPETQKHYHKPLVTHHALIGNAAEKIDDLRKQVETKDEELKEAGRMMKEIRELQSSQKAWIARLTEIVDAYHQKIAEAASERLAVLAATEPVEAMTEEEAALAAAGTQTRVVKARKAVHKRAA